MDLSWFGSLRGWAVVINVCVISIGVVSWFIEKLMWSTSKIEDEATKTLGALQELQIDTLRSLVHDTQAETSMNWRAVLAPDGHEYPKTMTSDAYQGPCSNFVKDWKKYRKKEWLIATRQKRFEDYRRLLYIYYGLAIAIAALAYFVSSIEIVCLTLSVIVLYLTVIAVARMWFAGWNVIKEREAGI